MLDIHAREFVGHNPPVIRDVEFFRIELASLKDGSIHVALTATIVDDTEPRGLAIEASFRISDWIRGAMTRRLAPRQDLRCNPSWHHLQITSMPFIQTSDCTP
jgi:hypothetical protein